jgi:hypothetical protein
MRFAPTEDQLALRDATRAVLKTGTWPAFTELGLFDLELTETDLVPILEQIGAAALPLPVSATAAVAVPLFRRLGRPYHGERIAVSYDGIVPFGRNADLVLDLEGHLGTPGEPVSTVDAALSATTFEKTTRITDDPDLRQRALFALAAELVGLGRRMLDMTVGYVKERKQFGVPVGSFQAVKHRLADAAMGIEFAAPAVLAAGWALQHHTDVRRDVAGAVVLAADAADAMSRAAIQCHGATGYTVEYDLHRYAKRVWALRALADVPRRIDDLAEAIELKEAAR